MRPSAGRRARRTHSTSISRPRPTAWASAIHLSGGRSGSARKRESDSKPIGARRRRGRRSAGRRWRWCRARGAPRGSPRGAGPARRCSRSAYSSPSRRPRSKATTRRSPAWAAARRLLAGGDRVGGGRGVVGQDDEGGARAEPADVGRRRCRGRSRPSGARSRRRGPCRPRRSGRRRAGSRRRRSGWSPRGARRGRRGARRPRRSRAGRSSGRSRRGPPRSSRAGRVEEAACTTPPTWRVKARCSRKPESGSVSDWPCIAHQRAEAPDEEGGDDPDRRGGAAAGARTLAGPLSARPRAARIVFDGPRIGLGLGHPDRPARGEGHQRHRQHVADHRGPDGGRRPAPRVSSSVTRPSVTRQREEGVREPDEGRLAGDRASGGPRCRGRRAAAGRGRPAPAGRCSRPRAARAPRAGPTTITNSSASTASSIARPSMRWRRDSSSAGWRMQPEGAVPEGVGQQEADLRPRGRAAGRRRRWRGRAKYGMQPRVQLARPLAKSRQTAGLDAAATRDAAARGRQEAEPGERAHQRDADRGGHRRVHGLAAPRTARGRAEPAAAPARVEDDGPVVGRAGRPWEPRIAITTLVSAPG